MRLIIIRHGETYWNTQKRTQGMTNTELTQRGHRQAKKLSFKLSRMNIKCIFTSPLERAKETASPIARACRCPIELCPNLREICFGEWEGLTFDRIGEIFPNELEIWNSKPSECLIPGGESLVAAAQRVDEFLMYINERYKDDAVVAVTHSVPSKLLVARSIGLPLDYIHSLRMDNASCTVIDFYKARAVMRSFNDIMHLMEGASWRG